MKIAIALVPLGLFALGCDGPTATTPTVDPPLLANVGNGVVHQVSVGGSDILPPGEDANFSLVAIEHGDGSVSGQWSDQFGNPEGGIHVDVDCVNVIGNQAWISGVVTSGTYLGSDVTGSPVITQVADNGTNANDPPDEISYSFIGDATSCLAAPSLPLFPITNGQVKVR